MSQAVGNPCAISREVARAALMAAQDYLLENQAEYRRRRDVVAEKINPINGLEIKLPEGVFYLYVNCGGLPGRVSPYPCGLLQPWYQY